MFRIKKLTKVFNQAKTNEISFNNASKFILFSDCHRGDGYWSDDFAHNQNIFNHALDYYYNKGFTYIEIGDGDELWKYHKFSEIREAHNLSYKIMSKFHKKKRFFLIWGNHNNKLQNPNYVKKNLYQYYQERKASYKPLFPDIITYEGIILKYTLANKKIFLVHGHQVDFINDVFWWFFSFLSKYLWKPLQLFGIKDPTSPAKSFIIRDKVEKRITEWARLNKQVVIAGHTHRSIFPKKNETPYFNTGSCVHPLCITGIEIVNGTIALIKWFTNTKVNGTLFIDKEMLAGPEKLTAFF